MKNSVDKCGLQRTFNIRGVGTIHWIMQKGLIFDILYQEHHEKVLLPKLQKIEPSVSNGWLPIVQGTLLEEADMV